MARANRHFIPGYIWHLTHRCHKREFLLKFSRDRARLLQLLFEARKRYRLSILNYMVTSNHIHLIITNDGNPVAIPKAMQYVAGRTGQEYNRRKKRKGAFWEDRYHATAIESGDHLWRCLVYVDLNMVRVGLVDHPKQWKWGGFNEIQNPKKRYRLIDHDKLLKLLNVQTQETLSITHRQWVEGMLSMKTIRQALYSRSIAVGSEAFVSRFKSALAARARGRCIDPVTDDDEYQLRETALVYRKWIDTGVQVAAIETGNENQLPWNHDLS